jgi:hypothetical protein
MVTTEFIIQTGIFVAVQICMAAYTIGRMKGIINGMGKRLDDVCQSDKDAHGRMTRHVEEFHARKD